MRGLRQPLWLRQRRERAGAPSGVELGASSRVVRPPPPPPAMYESRSEWRLFGHGGRDRRRPDRARWSLAAAAAAQRPRAGAAPQPRARSASGPRREEVPEGAAEWEMPVCDARRASARTSLPLEPPAVLAMPFCAGGASRGGFRRSERAAAVRLRHRDSRAGGQAAHRCTSMPALPARHAHAAAKQAVRPSSPVLVLPVCGQDGASPGEPPSPQEAAEAIKSCLATESGLPRRWSDQMGTLGRGNDPKFPAGWASWQEVGDMEPTTMSRKTTGSTADTLVTPVATARRGQLRVMTMSRQATSADSTTESSGTPVAAARPGQMRSTQSLPTLRPSRPSLPDVAMEIHKYAREMAVPLDAMRAAFSLFKDHAVVPSDGNLLTDGSLTRSKFVPLFRQMLGEASAAYDADEEESFLDHALKAADKNNDGVLSFHEFAIWYSSHCFVEGFHLDAKEQALRKLARKLGVSATEIDVYKRHFDTFDADGSGSIDREEFEEVLYKCGNVPRHIGLPASRINQLWMAADIDGSGEIDFEEFVIFFRKYFQKASREGDRTGFERYYSTGLGSLVYTWR
ncbi:unnamed protein product [Prorocentrum cordatum]|uniref:EF-hand domain-containing protein n=1 Tax=Prorocentrum cordatum TaxID=2364126 RepID=A0ABN9X3F8_9DINO|nr:unnamed protein product [Polarella glacialis]